LGNGFFVTFDFQKPGIKIRQDAFPIVRMDWVEGDPLGVWLEKHFDNPPALQKARAEFFKIASFLEREGIAHGDIQNGNVMMSQGGIKLIDYDAMFVPSLPTGSGSETGHKHFQHPGRASRHYGPKMDRFSFIVLGLSLQALSEDKSLHRKFCEGGETIIFKANDFADPQQSQIFQWLLARPKLKDQVRNLAAICEADIAAVPTLEDFLTGRNIPTARASKAPLRTKAYISAFPVVDALDFAAALRCVGDRVELIGKIVEVKHDVGRRGRARVKPYVFINFDEAQARFRLGNGSGTSPSSNQEILKKYVQTKTPSTAAQLQHRPSAYKPSAPSRSTQGFLSQIPGWVWVGGIFGLLFFLARH
jgi:hypothetical protein